MEHVPWIKDFLVFLAIAGLAVPILHRFGVSQILAFLVLGVAVGPYGLGRVSQDYPWLAHLTLDDPGRVAPFAELGVMALLFLIGLELSWSRLSDLRKFVAGVGGLQFFGCAAVLGGGAGLLGQTASAAAIIGLALAMSSTAVVMQIIESHGRTATSVGRIALSILLFQDLMVAPVLFTAGFMGGGAKTVADLGWTIAMGVGVVAAIVLIGRYALGSAFRLAAQTGSRELIMAISLLVLVGFSILTARAGLSAPLGAFLAGLLLSETEYRHQVEIDLSPFKGLLVGLFFISVGMTLDPQFVLAWLPQMLALALAILIVKAAIIWGAARAFRVNGSVAAEVALLLPQSGEFGFVALGVAAASQIISGEVAQFLVAVIALTMIATPLLARLARGAGKGLENRSAEKTRQLPDDDGLADHVIIGGFGRVGRTIARLLADENVPFVALDMRASLVSEQSAAGHAVYFGDASRHELLERAGAKRARAFVITLDEAEAAERMIAAIRELRDDVPVYARALDTERAQTLLHLGVSDVVPETFEASLQLGGRLLEALGVSDEAVAHRLARMREQLKSKMHSSTQQ